jgi:hypothetical protein
MMRNYVQMLLVATVCTLTGAFSSFAAETHLLKSKISNIEGQPIEGAKLFIYDSSNVRMPAQFISSLSDRTGQVHIALPPGKYWVVARFKSDGKYGPLMPGDKHSGEPLEVDVIVSGVEADFAVADIRELGQKKRTGATDAVCLKGRVLNSQGAAVAQAFVFANKMKEFSELPDFISAWTGEDGRYELYLSPGFTYYVGTSQHFPLKSQDIFAKTVLVESGKIDIAIDINLTVQ